MAAKPVSPAQMQEAVDALTATGGNASKAAESLGLPRGTFDNRIKAAKRAGLSHPDPRPKTPDAFTVKGDTAEISRVTPSRVKSLADLIRVCEIDTAEWEVERFTCNKWEMGSIPPMVGGPDGWSRPSAEPVVTELFQIKAWLKRKSALITAREEIAALLADAKREIAARPSRLVKRPASDNLLEPSIPDLHVGKLAWANETGWAHYDSKTAERVFEDALSALLQRTASFGIARIVLPVGNDLLHSDTKQGTTTAGTPIDNDSRYHKTFSLVRQMMTRAIDELRAVAPVHVVIVPGNHDTLSAFHLGDSLDCYFHRCKDVTVDNAPTMRKYYQWGKVMLMFTHGNKGKLADYPLVMAAEQPQMFGETIHREAHTGDKHQLKVQEHHGVRVRISPALCPPDAWHSEHHFVGNARSAEAFVWNKTEGLIGTANYTVTAPDRKIA